VFQQGGELAIQFDSHLGDLGCVEAAEPGAGLSTVNQVAPCGPAWKELILSRVLRSPDPFDMAITQLTATAEADADASIS
jgi:hypothetical protein